MGPEHHNAYLAIPSCERVQTCGNLAGTGAA